MKLQTLTSLRWEWPKQHPWLWCSRTEQSPACCSSESSWPWSYRYCALRRDKHVKVKGLPLQWTKKHSLTSLFGCKQRKLLYLALTFASAHRSSAPSGLFSPCPKERVRWAAPGKHGQTLNSGQSNPRPTATNFTHTYMHATIHFKAKTIHPRLSTQRFSSSYLWWVKSPDAYSNRRNSLRFEPKL